MTSVLLDRAIHSCTRLHPSMTTETAPTKASIFTPITQKRHKQTRANTHDPAPITYTSTPTAMEFSDDGARSPRHNRIRRSTSLKITGSPPITSQISGPRHALQPTVHPKLIHNNQPKIHLPSSRELATLVSTQPSPITRRDRDHKILVLATLFNRPRTQN